MATVKHILKRFTKAPLAELIVEYAKRRQLKGIAPQYNEHKTTLCYHGKPGNGWLCREPECGGEGWCGCPLKRQRGKCISCNELTCILCGKKVAGKQSLWTHIWETKLHKKDTFDDKARADITRTLRFAPRGTEAHIT